MRLTPQSLTTDRLVCTCPSASNPAVTHTVYGNRATGRIWCGPTCRARGEHNHTHSMRLMLADLETISTVQGHMDTEFLALQRQWLSPARVGAASLAYLSAQDILDRRQSAAA